MLAKNTLSLFVIGAGLIGAGVYLTQQEQGQSEFNKTHLVADFASKANALSQLKIISAGNTVVIDAQKKDGQWIMVNLDNYPVDSSKISTLVNELAQASIVEKKTAKAEKLHKLGLRDISNDDSAATAISLIADGSEYQILLGSYPSGSNNARYVRYQNNTQSYEIDRRIDTPNFVNNWIERKLYSGFSFTDIKQITRQATHNSADNFIVEKETKETPHFSLPSLPEGKQYIRDGIFDELSNAIAGFRFDAPVYVNKPLWQEAEVVTITFSLFNGLTRQMDFTKSGDDYWLKVSASGSDDVSKTLAEEFNNKASAWQYKIPEFSYEGFTKSMDNYIEAVGIEDDDTSEVSAKGN